MSDRLDGLLLVLTAAICSLLIVAVCTFFIGEKKVYVGIVVDVDTENVGGTIGHIMYFAQTDTGKMYSTNTPVATGNKLYIRVSYLRFGWWN